MNNVKKISENNRSFSASLGQTFNNNKQELLTKIVVLKMRDQK